MGDPVELNVTGGLPYARVFRITDGKDIWPELDDFELRSQVREKPKRDSPLVANLTPYLSAVFDVNDIVVTLRMNGAQTRVLLKGSYDILISDPGVADERALVVSNGPLNMTYVLTSAAGDV